MWENRVAGDIEIFGRRLAADGSPIGASFQISGADGSRRLRPRAQPAVAYDFERDRYVVAFTREQVVTAIARSSCRSWAATGPDRPPRRAARADAQFASATNQTFNDEIDVVYRPDATATTAPGDAYIVAYDGDDTIDDEFNVYARRVSTRPAGSFTGFSFDNVVSEATLEDAVDPVLVAVPGTARLAVVWEGSTVGGDFEIFARRAGNVGDAGARPARNGRSPTPATPRTTLSMPSRRTPALPAASSSRTRRQE